MESEFEKRKGKDNFFFFKKKDVNDPSPQLRTHMSHNTTTLEKIK